MGSSSCCQKQQGDAVHNKEIVTDHKISKPKQFSKQLGNRSNGQPVTNQNNISLTSQKKETNCLNTNKRVQTQQCSKFRVNDYEVIRSNSDQFTLNQSQSVIKQEHQSPGCINQKKQMSTLVENTSSKQNCIYTQNSQPKQLTLPNKMDGNNQIQASDNQTIIKQKSLKKKFSIDSKELHFKNGKYLKEGFRAREYIEEKYQIKLIGKLYLKQDFINYGLRIDKEKILKILKYQKENSYICKLQKVQKNEKNGIDFLTQYLNGQSMEQLLQHGRRLGKRTAKIYARDILRGLNSIHKSEIVHGNIKLSNILLNAKTRRIKFTDFFFFKSKKKDNKLIQSFSSPPEILLDKTSEPTYASDIWSVGYVILELFQGINPWKFTSQKPVTTIEQVKELVRLNQKFVFPSNFDEDQINFFYSIFQMDAEKRPTCQQLLNSKLIMSNIDDDNLFFKDQPDAKIQSFTTNISLNAMQKLKSQAESNGSGTKDTISISMNTFEKSQSASKDPSIVESKAPNNNNDQQQKQEETKIQTENEIPSPTSKSIQQNNNDPVCLQSSFEGEGNSDSCILQKYVQKYFQARNKYSNLNSLQDIQSQLGVSYPSEEEQLSSIKIESDFYPQIQDIGIATTTNQNCNSYITQIIETNQEDNIESGQNIMLNLKQQEESKSELSNFSKSHKQENL